MLAPMSNGSGRRIGVFGGTFDPPHLGHVAIALEVKHLLALDEIVFVVAGDPWQKSGERAITPAPLRVAMTEAAIAGASGVRVSTIEVDRDGPSYSVDTLEALRTADPDDDLFLIVGSDAAAGLDSWHRADDLAELATIVVVDRGGREGGRPPAGWPFALVDVPALEVSSSDLRRRAADGAPIRGMVAAGVADLIDEHALYEDAS